MTATTSRIPEAIDALVTSLTTALGTTANVVDGPPLSWDNIQLPENAVSETSFLFIGADPNSDTSADSQQDFNAAGAVSMDEQITIHCTAFVWSGDEKIKSLRDELFAIMATVDQTIRSDPSLGDAVLYARFAGVDQLSQRQTEDGSDVTATFTVACRAYLEN